MRRFDAGDLAHRLGRQAEAVCRTYLSAGRRQGAYWLVGDVRNTPGASMFVRLKDTAKGPAGKWQDAATGEHGDLLDVIREACNLADFADVAREARRFLSLPPPDPEPVRRKPRAKPARSGSTEAARRLFAMAQPLSGTLAEAYLAGRGITDLHGASSFRFRRKLVCRLAHRRPSSQELGPPAIQGRFNAPCRYSSRLPCSRPTPRTHERAIRNLEKLQKTGMHPCVRCVCVFLIGGSMRSIEAIFPSRQIITQGLYSGVPWTVAFHQAFEAEFDQLPLEVREALAATAGLLQSQGPLLGRPHADTLAGSDFANMKELRFDADDGVWRVAFAFDTARQAILLVAGDKAGVAQKRFYKALIAKADARFAEHLETLKG